MYTVKNARLIEGDRNWIAIGVLPPHVQETEARRTAYTATLQQAGAQAVLSNVQQLTPAEILKLVVG
jgi:HAD superfamily phosphatase